MRMRLSTIATAVDGRVVGDDIDVDGVSIDSRQCPPGCLFVPLVGERDGHAFIEAALAAGAAAHLTAGTAIHGHAVVVDDTTVALQRLARSMRTERNPLVVGITGSVGKTTTKDLLAAGLGASRRTHASLRSFNNELGVPLTLLNAPDDSEVVVAEMGARGVGHIAMLCDIALPDVGVVLCVGAAHTELFGDLDGVALAKGELVESLRSDGTAVLNADDERVAAMAARTQASVVTFGSAGDVRADDVELDDLLRPRFTLRSPWGTHEVHLAAAGAHSVTNALAALAVVGSVGADLAAACDALGAASLSPWRMEVSTTGAGAVVLNDAYNANPLSMHAAIDALMRLPARRRIAVVGLMAELGDRGDDDHADVGRRLADEGVTVISVGVAAYGGTVVTDADEALAALDALGVGDGDAVLVKASRVAGLERVAEVLTRA